MTTDAKRREATDQWAIQLREQQLRDLRAQLAAVTADRDDYHSKFRDLEHELHLERGQVVTMQQRAESAEAALNAVPVDAIASLVDSCERANAQEDRWCNTITDWLNSRK